MSSDRFVYQFKRHNYNTMKRIVFVFVLCHLGLSKSVHFTEEVKPEVSKKPEYHDITEKNLTYTLFTRRNQHKGMPLFTGDKVSLEKSGFDRSLPVKVCTHGFMDNGRSKWVLRVKEEILKAENVNFIVFDWSACAKNVFYEQAIVCMKKSGMYLGEFLSFLQKEKNVDLGKAHLIGHSLGAQLIGFTSKGLRTPKAIGRMTGLDPAGPLFEHVNETERLNKNSAQFVDVIHTCRVFTGIKKPIGTVDFYPNGGYLQPGCSKLDLACNHRSSHIYFVDSIDKKQWNRYAGKKCESLEHAINGTCNGETAVMGYHTDKRSSGIYYVNVTSILQQCITSL